MFLYFKYKKMNNFKKDLKKAFTLIEILIVVAIIWLLMMIFIKGFHGKTFMEISSNKLKDSAMAVTNIVQTNPDFTIRDITKILVWDENGVTGVKPTELYKTITKNLKTTDAVNIAKNLEVTKDFFKLYTDRCKTVDIIPIDDSSTYITTDFKGPNGEVFITNDSVEWIDVVCNLKKPENGYKKVHNILFWDTVSFKKTIHWKEIYEDKNYLQVYSDKE